MTIFLWITIFAFSLILLIKASDIFVDAAESIGLKAGLSSFITGVLIVGIGTSLPELGSSIAAVFAGRTEIVVGNVLGSNITNIFLVLGVAAVIGKEFTITHDLFKIDIPFLLTITFLFGVMILNGSFSKLEGIITIVAYLLYILFISKNNLKKNTSSKKKQKPSFKEILFIVLSPVGISLGAKYTVDSVVYISGFFGIASEIIALSAIALGTSLPEVFVTIAAARRGNPEIAVGNIIGSNIFNTLIVMGIPSLWADLTISPRILIFSLPVSIAAIFIFIFVIIDKKLNILEGGILLLFYSYFIINLFGLT